MSVFIRRFLSDPGNAVLLEIESVNILDLTPPATITGIGTGTIVCVGEFENGAFNTVTEVTSATDMVNTVGSLGYTQNGVSGYTPCAVARKADGALTAENWNGNGVVQLNAKKFARLLLVRVDTSVGSVTFNREASIIGASSFTYNLEPADILALDIGAGPVSATFTAGSVSFLGSSGTFPTLFAGGETLILSYDHNPSVTVTFQAADQTVGQVCARINSYFGFTMATISGGQVNLANIIRGTFGNVSVTGGTGRATLGLAISSINGTGNVANIDAVTFAEIKTIVEAAVTGTTVEQTSAGNIRIAKNYVSGADTITVGNATTATALGFVSGQAGANATGNAGTIPAGTVVTNAGLTRSYVTMQDVPVTAASAGPYTVKVRPTIDDGSGLSTLAGTVVKIGTTIQLGSFSVLNSANITAALTETAIDVAYLNAMNATLDSSSVAAQANVIFSARQSNQVRQGLRANALSASANGLYGRMALIRPPLGTSKATAQSTVSEPGVGAYRDQRVVYCYPGANTFVPIIGARGVAGGTGFTADGNVDTGADGFLASILSQLNPEENPGQLTAFTTGVNGLETAAASQILGIGDYTNFRASGICALRMDAGTAIFQSGVTSVDPLIFPNLRNIARRRMADFIQDSLALACKAFGKKLNTLALRKAIGSEIVGFMEQLLNRINPSFQRISGYTVDPFSGNTPDTLALGLFRIITNVRTLSSLDSIAIQATVGESVTVTVT